MKKNGEYDPPKYGSLKKTCRIMKATLLFLMLTVCHSFGLFTRGEARHRFGECDFRTVHGTGKGSI